MTRTLARVIPATLLVTATVWAQAPPAPTTPSATERFEVAAIKQGVPDGPRLGLRVRGSALELTNMPVTLLIERAHGVRSYQVVGGPDWMRAATFFVQARAAGTPAPAQLDTMIRALLAERFRMSAHTEQREMPAWILTRARQDGRLGPNLRPRDTPCQPGATITDGAGGTLRCGPGRLSGTSLEGVGLTMPQLAELLSGLWLNMPVVDRTGLSGQFDVTLGNIENQWGPAGPSVAAPSLAAPSGDAVSVPVAVAEQLGLRLELGRAPVAVLVVDRLERPEFD